MLLRLPAASWCGQVGRNEVRVETSQEDPNTIWEEWPMHSHADRIAASQGVFCPSREGVWRIQPEMEALRIAASDFGYVFLLLLITQVMYAC